MSAEASLRSNTYQQHIANRLLRAARVAARNAVVSYANEDEHELRQAAIDCGSAGEFLLKSILAEKDLTLLAAAGHPKSMVALSSAKHSPGVDFDQVSTVNTRQLIELFRAIDGNFKIEADYLKIQNVRNAAIHLAHVDPRKMHATVVSLVALIDLTLRTFRKDAGEFWGLASSEHVEKIRSAAHTEVDLRLSAKVTAARKRLALAIGSYGQLAAEERFAIAEKVVSNGVGETDSSVISSEICPACGHRGVEEFYKYRETSETPTALPNPFEPSEVDYWASVYPVAQDFRCGVCELHLDEAELAAAGLPRELEARDVLLEGYEPFDDGDSDWFYGR